MTQPIPFPERLAIHVANVSPGEPARHWGWWQFGLSIFLWGTVGYLVVQIARMAWRLAA